MTKKLQKLKSTKLDMVKQHKNKTSRRISPPSSVAELGNNKPISQCDALSFQPAVDSIAKSASALTKVVTEQYRPARTQLIWGYAKSIVIFTSFFMGAVFTLEQYLASQYDEAKARIEGQLSIATEALGSQDPIVQTNSVRTLARISKFSTYSVPKGAKSIGWHLRSSLLGYQSEYSYYEQIRLIIRDFATSRVNSSSPLVSSEILLQGSAWEHRTRNGDMVPKNLSHGSILFQANVSHAIGKDLDLHGIQFGSANFERADISGSNCSNSGMLGVNLSNATLKGTIFKSAYLSEAIMDSVDFSFAQLNGAIIRNAQLSNSKFIQADLTTTNLAGSTLDGSTFSQAILNNTDFTRSSLRNVSFLQSDVSTAIFDFADVKGADFTRAIGFSNSILKTALNSDLALIPNLKEKIK